jgi:DNA repair protein SbcD/Mre11
MRLVHFSDTHLGFSEFGRIDSASGLNAREVDVYNAFDRAIHACIELHPDLVIHAGDLFHTSRPSNRAIFKGFEGLKKLVDAGIPAVIIAGNHSTPRVANSGFIFEASRLLGINAVYGANPQVINVHDTAVHCVPHQPTAEALGEAIGNLRLSSKARCNVLVMHVGVRGTGEEFSLGKFNELILGKEAIANLRQFDYIALGHYHRFLQVAPNAFYSGSTERFSFREANYAKGILEVDLDKGQQKFHPLPCREIVLLKPIDCMNKKAGTILAEVEAVIQDAGSLEDKIVRLTFARVHPATWPELDRKQIREWTRGAFEVRLEPSWSESRRGESEPASIGGLAAEFAAYIKRVKIDALNKDRLQRMGEDYLGRAEEEEAE